MALSRFITSCLFGMVVLNSSVLAEGTKAGTEVISTSAIEYIMGGKTVKENIVKSKYIVDKLVQFKVTRELDLKQATVKGLTFLAPFNVTNYGNSIENFVLNISYGEVQGFSFEKTVIYIDKNNNGKLEDSEEVDNNVIKNLRPDTHQVVWLGAVTPENVVLDKKVRFGLEAKASSGGEEAIYREASKVNTILKEDIVFGDGESENDTFFNNTYIERYLWTIQPSIDLGMKLEINIMSADPLNGIAKTRKEAESGKFFSIPNATHVRSWKIYNDSLVTAKDIRFSINEDSKVERFAISSKKTWWKNDKRIHVLLSSSNKIIGQGVYNKAKKSVDFTIKELRGGEAVYPHVVTVIR
jgi:hypothetical protein